MESPCLVERRKGTKKRREDDILSNMNLRIERGSIIAFSIILLSILLTAGLSVASVASLERRSGLATEKSIVAFQAADSGTERVLERIYIDNSPSFVTTPLNGTMTDATLLQVAQHLQGTNSATCNTSTNQITATNTQSPTYSFEVAFFDGNDVQIACNDNAWRDKVVRIRTEGFFRDTARVLELGIKPRPYCDETITDTDGNVYNVIEIGGRCWTKQSLRTGTRIGSGTPQSNNGTIEYYCYGNTASNCTSNHPNQPDGGLYTWDEAMQYVTTEGAQGICPAGWHIPTDSEWNALAEVISPTDSSVAVPWSAFGWRGLAPVEVGTQLKPNGSTRFEMNLGGFFGLSGFVGRDTGIAYYHSSSEDGAINSIKIGVRNSEVGIARGTHQKATYAHFVRCILD